MGSKRLQHYFYFVQIVTCNVYLIPLFPRNFTIFSVVICFEHMLFSSGDKFTFDPLTLKQTYWSINKAFDTKSAQIHLFNKLLKI